MMQGRTLLTWILAGMVALGGARFAAAQDQTSEHNRSADNAKTNTRDRDKAEVTADQQKENVSDRELARRVRRAIVSDKSLSTYAHNIKVIAKDGTVTLKGPVHSDSEKQALEAKASEAVGHDKIRNEISVTNRPSAMGSQQQQQ